MFSPRTVGIFVLSSAAMHCFASEWDDVRVAYGNLTHLAGAGADKDVNSWTPALEGGNALSAELSNPHMAAADAAGNIYLADKESHSILKVTPAGTIHTVAGTHVRGLNGDGPALTCQLDYPNGVFVLGDGTFYIVDLDNQRIRRVGTDGQMTTVLFDLNLLGRALWVSPDQKTIYYAGLDASNIPALKKWTSLTGIQVVTSGFTSMGNIAVDREGQVLVTDDTGYRVYRIDSNGIKTVIAGNGTTTGGGDGFLGINTGLNRVRGVACLANGGTFLATQKGAHIWYLDTEGVIHKMMDCSTSGNVNAGNDQPYSTAGSKMSEPRAITIAPNGDLIITASDYGQIRVVKCTAPPPPPVLRGLELVSSTTRRLRWIGESWQSYFIDYSASLAPPDWQPLGVQTTEPGSESLYTLPATGSLPKGFYRLRSPR